MNVVTQSHKVLISRQIQIYMTGLVCVCVFECTLATIPYNPPPPLVIQEVFIKYWCHGESCAPRPLVCSQAGRLSKEDVPETTTVGPQ